MDRFQSVRRLCHPGRTMRVSMAAVLSMLANLGTVSAEGLGCGSRNMALSRLACTRIIEAGTTSKQEVARARVLRAASYDSDQSEMAQKDLEEALAADPDNIDARIALFERGMKKGDAADVIQRAKPEDDLYLGPQLAKLLASIARAKKHQDDGNGALAAVNRAIGLQPNDSEFHYLRGEIHAFLKEFDLALADQKKSGELDPTPTWRKPQLANLFVLAGRHKEALEVVDEAIAADQTSSLLYATRADVLVKQKEYRLAIESQLKAVQLDAKSAWAMARLADLYAEIGDEEKAASSYKKAADLDPSETTLMGYGRFLAKIGKNPDAAKAFDQAVAKKKSPYALDSRASFKAATGDVDGALADYKAALDGVAAGESVFMLSSLLMGRADLYEKIGEPEKALADLTTYVDSDGMNASSFTTRARFHERHDQMELARADIERAIAKTTKRIDARAAFSSRQRDYESAITDYTAVITANSKDKSAYLGRANAYRSSGKYDLALADADQIAALEPENESAILVRASVHLARGEAQESIALLGAALEKKPDNYAFLYARANAAITIQDFENAKSDLDRVIKLQPKNYFYLRARGIMLLVKGDANAAKADLQRAFDLEKTADSAGDLFAALARDGAGATTDMKRAADKVKTKAWPRKIVDLHMGTVPPEDVIAHARSSPSRTCEGLYHAALILQVKGNKDAALPLLKEVASDCYDFAFERWMAAADLRRLTIQ